VKDGKTIVSKDQETEQMASASQQIVLAETLPLKSLELGKYTVAIRVRDNARKQNVTRSETFELR
jgi:hypothetical protein